MNDPSNREQEPSARSQASALIVREKRAILALWEQRVRRDVPRAHREGTRVLRNSLPRFLDEIARTLPLGKGVDPLQVKALIASEHGGTRALWEDYSLEQVLFEYSLLREVILEVLDTKGAVPQQERDLIWVSIERAMRLAGAEFARVQRDALDDADRMKNEFLVMLGHELRSPLSAINQATHLLERTSRGEERVDHSRAIIERQVQHLIRLVDDLVAVSRVATGETEFRLETIDLRTVIENALTTSRAAIDERHHRLTTSLPEEPLRVNADRDRLAQVFINLLGNAARYTDEGGELSLTLQSEGDEAVIRLRDNGIGIAPEMLPHIFDMFTQVDASAARSRGGLGMGLTLAKRLVEGQGGSITARSEGLGKGSEFAVRLPRV